MVAPIPKERKITWKDGFRGIYCILHYNLPYCPAYIQFIAYLFVGLTAALGKFVDISATLFHWDGD